MKMVYFRITLVGLLGVSSAFYAMEKEEPKNNQDQATKNSMEFIRIIQDGARDWKKEAEKILDGPINPTYRDPETQQSLLEVMLQHDEYSVRNSIVKKLVKKGVPFCSRDKFKKIDKKEAHSNLLYVLFDKIQRKMAGIKGYKDVLYKYVHYRIKAIDKIAVTSLGILREDGQKIKAIMPKPLRKLIMKQSEHNYMFEDFIDALKQVVNTKFYTYYKKDEQFVDGFWSPAKWEYDMKAFYANPSQATTENNIFKKFLFWGDRKRSRTI